MQTEIEKISELDTLATAENSDYLVINDVSEEETMKITKQNLLKEINTTLGTATSDISTLQTNVGTLQTNVGTLQTDVGTKSSLNTTNKTSLVNAINEVNTGLNSIDYEEKIEIISVKSYSYAQYTIDTTKSGYISLGVVGIATNNASLGAVSCRNYSTSSIIIFRNFTSSNVSNATAYIRVLYKKS